MNSAFCAMFVDVWTVHGYDNTERQKTLDAVGCDFFNRRPQTAELSVHQHHFGDMELMKRIIHV